MKLRCVVEIVLMTVVVMGCSAPGQSNMIDRKSVVDRHNVVITTNNPVSPSQVGNGKFAFGMDITGLQTFTPFNTMSDWGWHSFPIPNGLSLDQYKQQPLNTHGREVLYPIADPNQKELSQWLAMNPHRSNLGRIGFILKKSDGTIATQNDIKSTVQRVDLWSGVVYSSFELDGVAVKVETTCHSEHDMIGVFVESDLVEKGNLSVYFDFPYQEGRDKSNYVGVYDEPLKHSSILNNTSSSKAYISRKMDDFQYNVSVGWETPATFFRENERLHRFHLQPKESSNRLIFSCSFSPDNEIQTSSFSDIKASSVSMWERYWNSGAAIDLSGSKDIRWKELERRVVLSQYLMRINESGLFPPQEAGLVNNGWYGRFHFEMIWWHGVHYGLWNRWNLVDNYLSIYKKFLPTSIERAKQQGYKGARWPKCTADFDREWPHPIHATLIWQQPHPIYFAEMDYRAHPTKATLDKWKDVVVQTADFMASYAHYDGTKGVYVLGPPLVIVSENTDIAATQNPTFELSYWRYGLQTALNWCDRLNIEKNPEWSRVLDKLAPLPIEGDMYVTHEGIDQMWTKYTYEHPALIGVLGMLPGNGVEKEVFNNTLRNVVQKWDFEKTWGWDFPMTAMAAARIGDRKLAIDLLLHKSSGFQFDQHGFCTGGPFPYFPANGGLLSAVAMMCGGWDGSDSVTPGFPDDGTWVVKHEGFTPMQ